MRPHNHAAPFFPCDDKLVCVAGGDFNRYAPIKTCYRFCNLNRYNVPWRGDALTNDTNIDGGDLTGGWITGGEAGAPPD